MKYHELSVKSHKSAKRVGRGIASGHGKTAGRGTKGQKSRAGWSRRPGFAGGQNPLMQQLPKLPGFRSYRSRSINVFTDQIDALKTLEIDTLALEKAGLIASQYESVKLLKRGELNSKHNVKLQAASKSAIEALEGAGGSFIMTERTPRPASTRKKTETA